ncbi:MAG: hypothetical protein AAGJ83_09600, partial [Planctomycetota bacterium]
MTVNPSDQRRAVPEGRDAQAFPALNDDQIQRLSKMGDTETLESGAIVFQRGQREADFLVVLEGCIEIFDFDCDGNDQVFVRHCE